MSDVLVETVGRTRVITLNRPHARNALTRGVLVAIRTAIDAADNEDEVRCILLTGAGGHFCSGADLRQTFAEDPEIFDHLDDYMHDFHGVIRALVRSKKPTVAAMDGGAVGFGADLGFACDLRVATTDAYVQEKFVSIGLMPDGGGTFWLPRLVGTARALRMMLLADKVGAQELHDLGVLVDLVAAEKLREAALALTTRLEAGPPLAYAAIKQAVYASWGSLEDALRREREGQLRLLRSADAMEGVMAWTQKRAPSFRGE
jgi:enoyl-CoA hydratase/carnithine racemase